MDLKMERSSIHELDMQIKMTSFKKDPSWISKIPCKRLNRNVNTKKTVITLISINKIRRL